jgi:aspartyl-tRNA(Asn)/glutamyl-tRNA(Gln) amidotransferase subunit A
MEALHRLSISELCRGFSCGDFRVVEIVEHMLARISASDPNLRAFIEVDEAGSREAAADSEGRFAAGKAGPLEGIPVAVKANIGVTGLEISAGMEARRGLVAEEDAVAVARLRQAGAIVLGALNMHEAALGADNDNPWFGRAMNPHGNGRTPGGSSGGSAAAVAAGLCVASLGTDTLGSIRIPAAYCGIYGLKPSAGAVSQQGLELVVRDFDTIGPLARTLDDLEAVFTTISDARTPKAIGRISLLKDLGGVRCEPAVSAAYSQAVAALRLEGLPVEDSLELDLKPIRLAGFVQAARELGTRLHELRETKGQFFSESLCFLLDYGAGCSDHDVSEGSAVLEQARAAVRAAVGDGALLIPTAPQAAFVHGSRAPANQADFTALASISGLPALSLPAGTDATGMPVAVQLVGAEGNELGLIDLARRLEKHFGGFIPPPIF